MPLTIIENKTVRIIFIFILASNLYKILKTSNYAKEISWSVISIKLFKWLWLVQSDF